MRSTWSCYKFERSLKEKILDAFSLNVPLRILNVPPLWIERSLLEYESFHFYKSERSLEDADVGVLNIRFCKDVP